MRRVTKRQILVGVVGNILEWYGFAVYGCFALTIGRSFYPNDVPFALLLTVFVTQRHRETRRASLQPT
jgi:MHS family proline/betaine transporter-like MFS transporter